MKIMQQVAYFKNGEPFRRAFVCNDDEQSKKDGMAVLLNWLREDDVTDYVVLPEEPLPS